MPLDKDFVQSLRAYTEENDILLIVDEVQTGNGRTGSLYAYMQYGITPDVVTTAKGLAGGLPLGATLFAEKVKNVLGFGDHGSTFGGNPVCCAAACSILERIDDDLLRQVREKNPGAMILCVLGIMGTELNEYMVKAVNEYRAESGDTRIHSMTLQEQDWKRDGYGSNFHPNEKTQKRLAQKIQAFLQNT